MKNYFDCFKSARVIAELSKGNLTKNEEYYKTEMNYGNTTNPDKMAEDKFLSMNFLEYNDPGRYNNL